MKLIPRRFQLIIFVCILFVTSIVFRQGTARAGFEEGLAAYNRHDYSTALKEWRPLAEQGVAEAQLNLAHMYYKGEGVPQDYKEAVTWSRKAAEQDVPEAQHALAYMYYKGEGVPQDYKEALSWYRKGAEQGFAASQFNLGLMYAKGQGVAQDYVRAHMWFNLAGAAGQKGAVKTREVVEKRMTSSQIEEAQRLAREWRPKKSQ